MADKKQKLWHFHNLNRQFWISAIQRVVPHAPCWFVTLGRSISVLLCFVYMRQERRGCLHNLKQITGQSRFKCVIMALQLLNNYAKQLVVFALHDWYTDDYWQKTVIQEPEQYQKVTRALELGRGVILISAHLGSWELGKHVLADKKTKVNMVMVPSDDPTIEDFWNRFRARDGLQIINLKSSPFAAVEILDALRRNEIVLLQGDRTFNHSCLRAPFFGKPALFPTGPIVLARMSKAPVLGAFVVIESEDSFRVIVDDTLDFSWTNDKQADIERNVARMAVMLETIIQRYLTQWYTFYNFWGDNGTVCF
ncbi:lysophospholipid acyltransferase family protein [bacterium]|nr:lysophospholipid acyltransferase family protein [bacterium]